MFYDDASLQDLSSARGAGQKLMNDTLELIGGRSKPTKSQRMASSSDFLGLIHDVSDAFSTRTVSFTPRPALVEKVRAIASAALEDDVLLPTAAGKLLGI